MKEQMKAKKGQRLDSLYEKFLNGIPKICKPINELANNYIRK